MKDALDLIMELLGEEYDGDVDSPTGTFWRVSVNADENVQNYIEDQDAYAAQVAKDQDFDWDSLVGEWLVTHDDRGFTFPVKFDTAELADAAYAELEAAYEKWCDTEYDYLVDRDHEVNT